MASRKPVIITYNGVDGACAAAMAFLAFPKASLVVSSARAIAWSLAAVAETQKVAAEIHVCGLGVACDWDEVRQHAEALQANGSQIIWYCGRGYLDADRPKFEQFASPVFLDVDSNTRAVCHHLGLNKHGHARFLLDLAKTDPQIGSVLTELSTTEQFWFDLVAASFAEYAKYQDRDRYLLTIQKLALGKHDRADDQLVESYRQFGFKYALEGPSKALRKLRDLIRKCTAAEGHVLVLGESGVGKEHVAHLIHERGARATEPFVVVNCAQFAGNVGLANSALFGHRKGAYTGATEDRKGAFREASGGVLFLDELGELPLEAQGKLLRVLEDGMVTGEGCDRPVKVDTRVIAATNSDLPAMIRQGRFRADLFHRLAALRILAPPLRERPEDIDVIVNRALDDWAAKGVSRKLSRQERNLLRSCDWPGNVRQLLGVLRRAVQLELPVAEVLEEEQALGSLQPESATVDSDGLLPRTVEGIQAIEEIQREYARRALELHGGNYRVCWSNDLCVDGCAVDLAGNWRDD